MSEHFIAGLSTVTYGIRDGRSISVDEFMNTFLAFPAVEEQAAISRLFDYLDDLITLHQRKRLSIRQRSPVVPEFLRTLVFARPRGDDQFADCTFSPSLDMSR